MTEEQWSPAQIVGWLRKHGKDSVCVETIYAYIRADKQNGGDLWKHCRHRLKHRKRQVSASYTVVQNRTMIDERPQEWDGDNLRWREEYAPPILARIEEKLNAVKTDPHVPADSDLMGAVKYALNEWEWVPTIFSRGDYDLDNNLIERM